MEPVRNPSAVAWSWRKSAGPGDSRAREAAAARTRGAIGGAVGLSAAAAVYYFFEKPVAAAVIAGIAILIALTAFLFPLTLYKQLNHGLQAFARAVGTAVTWVLMTALFYLLFLPVGLVLRARGRLGITRGADPKLSTYWTPTDGRARTPGSYRKQF